MRKKLLTLVLVLLVLAVVAGPVYADPPSPEAPWSNTHAGWTPPAPRGPGPR